MIPPDSGQQPPSNYAKPLSHFSHIAENPHRVSFHLFRASKAHGKRQPRTSNTRSYELISHVR